MINWLVFVLLAAARVVLFETPSGLGIRSAVEHQRVAERGALSVSAVRDAAVAVSAVSTLPSASLVGGTGRALVSAVVGRPYAKR